MAQQHQPNPVPTYKFSKEEMQVLRECNNESFWKRSIPFSALFCGLTHVACKNGILKMHPRWGSTFKVMGAGLIGYIVGKFSYRSTCEDKFLRLPNSPFAEMIKKRRGLIPNDSNFEPDQSFSYSNAKASKAEDRFYSDFNSDKNNVEIDSDKNVVYSGLEEPSYSNLDSSLEETAAKKVHSYDELRQKNRIEYEKRRSESFIKPPSQNTYERSNNERISRPPREDSSHNAASGQKNAYGDVWEN